MHSGTRRVRDDYVGVTVATDKLFVQHVFHVSGVEYRVVDIVETELILASSIASGTYSMPMTFWALRATKLAMVPVPV